MKMLKKLLSAVCAVSLLATSASFMIVHADDYPAPTMSAELTEYNSETGEGMITVSLEGIITGEYEGLYPYITGFQSTVAFSDADFDTSMYSSGAIWDEVLPGDDVYDGAFALNDNGYGTDTQGNPGIVVAWSPTQARRYIEGSLFAEKNTLYTFNFKVLDTSKENTITLKENMIALNIFETDSYTGTLSTTCTYGTVTGSMTQKALNVVDPETIGEGGGDITITIPANDGTTAEGDNLVSIAPEDIGGEGTVWTDDEGNGEAAVASVANFTSNNAGSVTWSITATPAEGEAVTKSHAFDIPAVEGQMTLGLIVGYDTAEWNSVAITGGAIE